MPNEVKVEFAPQVCLACGVRFAIDAEYLEFLVEHQGGVDHHSGDDDDENDPAESWKRAGEDNEKSKKRWKGTFCCPNGHRQHFTGPTPEDKQIEGLKQELARTKQRAERIEADLQATNRKLNPPRQRVQVCEVCGERKPKKGFRRTGQTWRCPDCQNSKAPTTATAELVPA